MNKYTEGPIMVGKYDIEAIINNIINFVIALVTFNFPEIEKLLEK